MYTKVVIGIVVTSVTFSACSSAPPAEVDGSMDGSMDSMPSSDGAVLIDGAISIDAMEIPTTINTRIAAAPSGGEIHVGHCDIDDTGTIYVVWQQEDEGQDVWFSRSKDGGETFETPIGIETGPENPYGGWGNSRKPYVISDGLRVAVVYGVKNSKAVLSVSLEPLQFSTPAVVGTASEMDVEEFVKPLFDQDGNLEVFFHHTQFGNEAIMISREKDGWSPEPILGETPGQPCDCCPHDIRMNKLGTRLLAYRNNIENVRDQYVTRAAADSPFNTAVPGSHTNWTIYACPVDGPRLGENTAGDQLLVWSDPTSGKGRIWISNSFDDGVTWEGDRIIADMGQSQHRPSITLAGDGTLWVTMDQKGGSPLSLISKSSNGGQTFEPPATIMTEEGALNAVELCSGGGKTGLVGVTPTGSLYWLSL